MTLWSKFFKTARRASIPEGWRVYAIGDVHGCVGLLDQLLARIDADIAEHASQRPFYVFLGDYVDRGPASNAVIDRLIELRAHRQTMCLKGNHEAVFLEFFDNPGLLLEWSRFGGFNTLMSYGIHPPMQPDADQCVEIAAALAEAMPLAHRRFLRELDLSLTFGDFFFVHAGARPNIALDRQSEEDLLWIREDFLLHEAMFEKIVVHGHSPVREPEILANRINIDTGAYATGRLTCLVLQGDKMRFL